MSGFDERCTVCGGELDTAFRCMTCGTYNSRQQIFLSDSTVSDPNLPACVIVDREILLRAWRQCSFREGSGFELFCEKLGLKKENS